MPRTTTLVLVLLALVACQSRPPANPGERTSFETLATIRDRGELRVGVADFAPWVMVDRHGKRIGYEVDVAAKLAEDMGARLVLVPMTWRELIPVLEAGRIDVIASGMSITPTRALLVNFSMPYHHSAVTIYASVKNAPGLTKRTDFDRPLMRIASVRNTTGETAVRAAFPEAENVPVDTDVAALEAVRSGKAHAAAASSPAPRFAALRYPEEIYLPLAHPLTRTGEAFAIRPGDPDFLAFLNAWIEVRRLDRFLERRAAYWFMGLDWERRL